MLRYFFQLLKFKLSITVVFSALAGYLLGVENFEIENFIYLIFGGFLVTGSANAFNQILEKAKKRKKKNKPWAQIIITLLAQRGAGRATGRRESEACWYGYG